MLSDAPPRDDLAARSRGPRIGVFQLLSHAFRRFGWGVADQAVSSVTNFAVSIYVVREMGAAQFGAFSLAYVTYAFALNASRGLATEPLMVRFSNSPLVTWRRAVARCTGTAAVVGLVGGALVLCAALVLGGTTRLAFVALGLTLPGLMLQDSWRYSFFALGRGSQAFLNDCIWAATLLPAMAYLRYTGNKDVFWFVLAWGATAAIAAAAGPLQARVMPRLAGVQEWVWQHRDLGPRFAAENTSAGGAAQLRTYAIGLLLGLTAIATVQAANILMGPLTILFLAMSLVAIPEGARVLSRSPHRFPLFCVLLSAGEALGALAWGVILLIALPRGFGLWLLGPIWRPTYPLVLPQVLYVAGLGIAGGAVVALHALGAARRSLRAMLLTASTFLVGSLVGAAVAGPAGTVRGAAIAGWVGAAISWWQLHAVLKEPKHAEVASHFWFSRQGRRRGGSGE